MKIYTIKDEDGILRPKTILTISEKAHAVRNGEITLVDYGKEEVEQFIEKSKANYMLAVCKLVEIK